MGERDVEMSVCNIICSLKLFSKRHAAEQDVSGILKVIEDFARHNGIEQDVINQCSFKMTFEYELPLL